MSQSFNMNKEAGALTSEGAVSVGEWSSGRKYIEEESYD